MVIGCLRLRDVSDQSVTRVDNTADKLALSVVLSTHIGRRKEFDEVSCTQCTFQGNDFKLIPTVKRKLEIPLRVILVVNFRRSVIIAELWRSEVARR